MEICEAHSAYSECDDGVKFDHTKIILRRGDDEYFYAKSSQRLSPEEIDIDALEIFEIPTEHIWPLADPKFTQAPNPLPAGCYLKRPTLIHYQPNEDNDVGNLILTEVEACEVLRQSPHPNIVRYLGCMIKDGRIRGLVFDKYPITLWEMLDHKIEFDKSHCLHGIEAGVQHMHDLGLVHNDLNPSNIMMDGNHPIIIDFDSCKSDGKKLGKKGGTYMYSLEDEEYSKRDNDLYSLSKIRESVMQGKTLTPDW
ncbi:hypothetical protein NUW58_g8254 [Xylaria curta]|uniref:Uncharacterized protein n=1 Tax=Xylaria curta TaxID=42375 RepID=A0ACC1N947_9PEZI|nr:hypothetical protein NUW58_g8254 [Xylaria curta]